jgi:hypothetical protein
MMTKLVIHIFHADDNSLRTGSHVSERIRQVKDQHGVELEVYVFGPAERALDDSSHADYRHALVSLAKAGVPVHICRDIAESMGKAREFTELGFTLEYARDAFVRYAVEAASVISF